MKKLFVFFIAILLFASCNKQSAVDETTADKWNGYEKYLKMGEVTHPLLAGANKQTNIGTATYGIDDDANFYVTYTITGNVWKISQTSMYCGDKKNMPLNKAGNPRINRFPHKKTHNPKVTTYTIRVPLTSLPPAQYPGFVVAAHCVVYNPQKCDGTTKNCWADGDFAFTDKDWGWYDIFYFNQPPNEYTILYGTAYTTDTLKLYRLDVTNGTTSLIYKEKVQNSPGTYDGTAFDVDSSMFFFTNTSTGELFANRLNDTLPSFITGNIIGVATSGTFDNGAYYYVNESLNTINKVTFTSTWAIASETILDTIPSTVRVNDIAMNPEGNILYMLGEVNGGGKELISWNTVTETFYTMSISINNGAQIAYGSDGVLYAIAPITPGGSHSLTFTLDPNSGILTEIEDDVIIIDDPFSDISTGPIM